MAGIIDVAIKRTIGTNSQIFGYAPDLSYDGDLADKLLDCSVGISNDYYEIFSGAEQLNSRLRLRSFLYNPDIYAKQVCAEHPAPSDFLSGLVSFSCRSNDSGPHVPAFALLHAGHKDSIAPLHFDWDMNWAINFNLFGRKVMTFFPPAAAWLLVPVINTSGFCYPRLAESEKIALAESLGGIRVELGPGEGVQFPSLWWHSAEYLDTTLSLSIRFGGPDWLRPLATLPRHWRLQRVAWAIWKRGRKHDSYPAIEACLRSVCMSEGWLARYNALAAECDAVLAGLDEEPGYGALWSAPFNAELACAAEALQSLYADPSGEYMEDEIRGVADYIFSARRFARPLETAAATRALSFRQGLPPKRGLLSPVGSR